MGDEADDTGVGTMGFTPPGGGGGELLATGCFLSTVRMISCSDLGVNVRRFNRRRGCIDARAAVASNKLPILELCAVGDAEGALP